MSKHVTSFFNRVDDIEISITLTDRGLYAVQIIDIDTSETVPAVVLFTEYSNAEAYAIKCALNDANESNVVSDEDLPF